MPQPYSSLSKAFSAIELIGVLLIMGLIISLGCLGYQQSRLASFRQSTLATFQTIAASLAQADSLPTALPESLPTLDAWGTPIRYELTNSHYSLSSAGSDAAFNTPDDIIYEQESL